MSWAVLTELRGYEKGHTLGRAVCEGWAGIWRGRGDGFDHISLYAAYDPQNKRSLKRMKDKRIS